MFGGGIEAHQPRLPQFGSIICEICRKHEGLGNLSSILLVEFSRTVTVLDEPFHSLLRARSRVRFSRTKLVSRRELNLLDGAGPTDVVEGCNNYLRYVRD